MKATDKDGLVLYDDGSENSQRYAYILRLDKTGKAFASADIAAMRLREITKDDRKAVPCGQWVLRKSRYDLQIAFALGLADIYDPRPRYRYEVRQ